jgi:hypothetical protein
MDKAALVTIDLDAGAEMVQALEKPPVNLNVALWMYLTEYGDWRVVLSSRRLDAVPPREAYGLVHDALDSAGFRLEQIPPLLILRMSDPLIRELRRRFSKAKSVEGMRLGSQLIGDKFVEDAYVYRIS